MTCFVRSVCACADLLSNTEYHPPRQSRFSVHTAPHKELGAGNPIPAPTHGIAAKGGESRLRFWCLGHIPLLPPTRVLAFDQSSTFFSPPARRLLPPSPAFSPSAATTMMAV